MDISPKTNIIKGMQNLKSTLPNMIMELIDNSRAAEASDVHIDMSKPGVMVITDNGNGCDDLSRMLSYGDRLDYNTDTEVGMYGSGGKQAMIWLASETEIASVCRADMMLRMICVNWEQLSKSNAASWEVDDPVIAPASEGDHPGTTITLNGLRPKITAEKISSLCKTIGATYAPAIREGVLRVYIRPPASKQVSRPQYTLVPPLPDPDLRDAVSTTFAFSNKRIAHVKMGILADSVPDKSSYSGISLALKGGRLMRSKTRIGLGSTPTPGLYGMIEISPRKGWDVHVLKDGLSERHEDEIGERIAHHTDFARLIEKARNAAHDVQLEGVNSLLCAMMEEITPTNQKTSKARRAAKQHHTGTIIPLSSGSPHQRARRTQPGNRFPGNSTQRRSAIQLSYANYGDGPLFNVEGCAVIINRDHEFYRSGNVSHETMIPMAIMYFAVHDMLSGQQLIPFPGECDSKIQELPQQTSYLLAAYARVKNKTSDSTTEGEQAS